jgi:hypothetical protein
MAFNRIEDGLGLKPLQQDKRHGEAEACQQVKSPLAWTIGQNNAAI